MFHDDLIYEEHQAEEQQNDEITQEDAWAVISAFFEEKGLVRQQLDSFNEFISNTMQEIIDETPEISVKPESQHVPGMEQSLEEKEFKLSFGQIYLSKPSLSEEHDTQTLFPKEARLRNLTWVETPGWACMHALWFKNFGLVWTEVGLCRYCAPLYIDLTRTEVTKKPNGESEENVEKYEKLHLAKVTPPSPS